MKIEINKVVNAEYELYVDGENGELELMERAGHIIRLAEVLSGTPSPKKSIRSL